MKVLSVNNSKVVWLYYVFFIVLGMASLFDFDGYNPLPTSLLFEILFFITFLVCLSRSQKKECVIISAILFCYFSVCYILSLYNDVFLMDYLVAYKFLIYLGMLPLVLGKEIFNKRAINCILWMLLSIFILKYTINLYISSPTRPGVFFENNYELCFILLLYFLDFTIREGKEDVAKTIFLVLILLMSGSRSALVSFVFMYGMMLFISKNKIDIKLLVKLISIVLSIVVVSIIFSSRIPDGGLSSIDRFVFFNEFMKNITDWEFLQYIKGSSVLTPLSNSTCRTLVFYSGLFSADGTTCYSVILHSFVLRVVYDHGFIGLILTFFILNFTLRVKGYRFPYRITIVMIIFLNSLSVSAVNSIYVIMGVLLCLITTCGNNKLLRGRSCQ